jgi:hypothetical protein
MMRDTFVRWAVALVLLLLGAARVTFERPIVYGGHSDLSWMTPFPFVEKLGVQVGVLLRVSNVSSAPVYILGRSRDSISIGIETQEGTEWQPMEMAGCFTGMKPLQLAAGESFDLQVPVPIGAKGMRVSIAYRASDEPDPLKGNWLSASSEGFDVRRLSGAGGKAPVAAKTPAAKTPAANPPVSKPPAAPKLGIAAAVHAEPAPKAGAADQAPPPSDVRLAFDRVVPYGGKTHEAWTSSYAFIEKRGVTVGALLHLTNTSSAPLFVLGFNRDALSVRVEAKGGSGWRGLLINEESADLKPLQLAAGESIDVQVPLPDDSRRIRISVVYRASSDPDWNTGGWVPAYSDAIDVKKVRK